MTQASRHIPVLLHEAITALQPHSAGTYVDATIGGGGHTQALCEAAPGSTIVGIDADREAIARAQKRNESSACSIEYVVGNFAALQSILAELQITAIDGCLFDFGISSDQLEVSNRGFSFKRDEPLRMTLKRDIDADTVTAWDVVNTWDKETLQAGIQTLGEERFATRIAEAIVTRREKHSIDTTKQLHDCIHTALPASYVSKQRIDPATRTFQAIRILVNSELSAIETGLVQARTALKRGGRIVAISFHSLEDRIVKQTFRDWEESQYGTSITKKPITASAEEVQQNPRARSAKLRVFQTQ